MQANIFNYKTITSKQTNQLTNILKAGKIAVLPTDTIYGIHGLALNQDTVQKIYDLKGRDDKKPLIVVISSLKDLELFDIKITEKQKNLLEKIWPNSVSVVFESSDKFKYLHRGTKTLAIRFPNNKFLNNLVEKVGPLISTSANISQKPAAENIEQATKYFGSKIDIYLDAGDLKSEPSTVVRINGDTLEILRQGKVKIPQSMVK